MKNKLSFKVMILACAGIVSCSQLSEHDSAETADSTPSTNVSVSGSSTADSNIEAIEEIDLGTLNEKLLPQEIGYDGKPGLEYTSDGKIVALESYDENDIEHSYIRMKFNGKEDNLILQENTVSKVKRIYSNKVLKVTFYDIVYGECAGEGAQYLAGKILIQTKSEHNIVDFEGFDGLYSSKECQAVGNGG